MLGWFSVSSCQHMLNGQRPARLRQPLETMREAPPRAHLGAKEDIVRALHAQHQRVVLVAHLQALAGRVKHACSGLQSMGDGQAARAHLLT